MPEQITFPSPERLERRGFESPETKAVERPQERPAAEPSQPLPTFQTGTPAGQRPSLNWQTERLKAIEQVLEEDLAEIYFQLPPEAQAQFKAKGEAAAAEIHSLMDGFKATAGKIAEIIRAWLQVIPGVNRFFLEQEVKIKTDKLMAKYQNL